MSNDIDRSSDEEIAPIVGGNMTTIDEISGGVVAVGQGGSY